MQASELLVMKNAMPHYERERTGDPKGQRLGAIEALHLGCVSWAQAGLGEGASCWIEARRAGGLQGRESHKKDKLVKCLSLSLSMRLEVRSREATVGAWQGCCVLG